MRCDSSIVALQAPAKVLRRAAIAASLAVCIAACGASAATAAPGHRFVGQFGGPGTGHGAFSGPAGLSVQQSTGDVYVADQSNGRVQKFDATGKFIVAFDGGATPAGSFSSPAAVAVDPSSGDVYVADTGNNAVDRFTSSGAYVSQLNGSATPAGMFASPSGVAVDPSNGNVYVSDSADAVVDIFGSAGEYLTQFGVGALLYPTSIAVSGASEVYLVDAGVGTLYSYPALGAGEPTVLDAGVAATVGVNPVSNEVYVGEYGPAGFQVGDLTESGNRMYTFGAGHIAASAGIAVNASSDEVYVADQAAGDVAQFAPFLAPTVTTGGSSAITASSASIAGTVNPEGVDTSYHFEFGTDAGYGSASPEVEAGSGNADVPATYAMEALQPNTTYHYRTTASNTLGSNVGEDGSFTTAAAAPVVDAQAPFASSITVTGATLHATIDPRNSATTYHFNYGASTAYGSSAPTPDAEGGSAGEEAVSVQISQLQPGTTYHFQVVADNGTGGPVAGEDATFTTLPPPPSASTGSASAVTQTSVLLAGSANTNGLSGTYQFQVTGVDNPGSDVSSPRPLSPGSGEVSVSGTVTGLSPGMHYTYRLAVTTAGGAIYGAELPLATAPITAYAPPTGANGLGPLNAGLPTPITQLIAYVAPPAESAPVVHPKPKPKKHKKKRRKRAAKKHTSSRAKKANANAKGHR